MATIKWSFGEQRMKRFIHVFIFAVMAMTTFGAKHIAWQKDKKHCEVCLKVMTDIKLQLSHLPNLKDINRIESYLNRHCSAKNRNLRTEERLFCKHLLPISRQISTPLSYNIKGIDICKKMHRIDHTICDYKYTTVHPLSHKHGSRYHPDDHQHVGDHGHDEL